MNLIYVLTLSLIMSFSSLASAKSDPYKSLKKPLRKAMSSHRALINRTIRLTAAYNKNQLPVARMVEVWRDELIPANREMVAKLVALKSSDPTTDKMIALLLAYQRTLVTERNLFESANFVNQNAYKTSSEAYYTALNDFMTHLKSAAPRRNIASRK